MTPHPSIQSHPSTAIHASKPPQGGAVFCTHPVFGRVQATVRGDGRIEIWVCGAWRTATGLSDRQESGIRRRYAAIR